MADDEKPLVRKRRITAPAPEPAELEKPEPEQEQEREPEPDHAMDIKVETAPARLSPVLLLVLGVVALALVVVGVLELRYLRDEPEAPVSAARPVVVPRTDYQPAVDAAATSLVDAFTWTSATYDDHVDDAAKGMSETYATEYRQTAADISPRIARLRVDSQISVVAQGVVQASAQQVKVQVFFDQLVTQKGQASSYSRFRAVLTMVPDGDRWLVDEVDTE